MVHGETLFVEHHLVVALSGLHAMELLEVTVEACIAWCPHSRHDLPRAR